ncbi:MAG: glycine zipper family protein [Methylomonas sp.]|jgi:hypothetical protein
MSLIPQPATLSLSILLLASGCASVPTGPSVMVLPASGQSFDQFRNDDVICRQFADSQLGGTTANDAAVESGVGSAVVGTLLGAALGAAVGGGRGAAIGAGSGLVAGSVMGLGASGGSMNATQQRYDDAYLQCMYAKGHQVPVSGRFSNQSPYPNTAPYQSAPPAANIPPPPPPGSPPPPPQ